MIWLLVFLVITMCLLAVASYFQKLYEAPDKVAEVHAGNIRNVPNKCKVAKDHINPNNVIFPESEENNGKYMPLCVWGDCLSNIGIDNGDLIYAEMFVPKTSVQTKVDTVKEGDILLIYLFSWKFRGYKIRVFEKEENGKAKTYYFNEDGSRHYSSRPHEYSKVVGIVKYKEKILTPTQSFGAKSA